MEYNFDNIYMKRFLYFNVYVIKGKRGDILIDTGFIFMRKPLEKWLSQFNIKLIILTHAHVDHVWNADYLSKKFKAKIAMCEDDIINLDNSRIHAKPLKRRYGLWTRLMNLGMKLYRPPKFKVDILLNDKKVLRRFGLKLDIIKLSGHTDGSIGILYNKNLFVGDALVYRGKYPTVAYQCQNIDDAKHAVSIIDTIHPDRIFVGHDMFIESDEFDVEKAC